MFLKLFFLLIYFLLVFVGVRIIDFSLESFSLNSIQDAIVKFLPKGFWNDMFQDNKTFFRNDSMLKKFVSPKIVTKVPSFSVLCSFQDYIEKIEDTNTSIWLVLIRSYKNASIPMEEMNWNFLSDKLTYYGIKTATYDCNVDHFLCLHLNIHVPSLLLTIEKENIAVYKYSKSISINKIFQWVQRKLYFKLKSVQSFKEISSEPVANEFPSMLFIYSSSNSAPPLFFTSLSVTFSGRVEFYILKSSNSNDNAVAMNKYAKYNYGKHKGENFSYKCINLFLRTLHPELNDIFIFSVILFNMACWLEIFLQKGGPIRRIIYYIWGCLITNIVLVSLWIFIIQVINLPQVQPITDIFLKALQYLMFSDVAATIRQDFLQVMQHLYIATFGFFFYGVILGYLRYKFLNHEENESGSLVTILLNDFQDLNNMMTSLFSYITPRFQVFLFDDSIDRVLQRLSTPDLWLHPLNSLNYIQDLPSWKFSASPLYNNNISCSDECKCKHADKVQCNFGSIRFTKSKCSFEDEIRKYGYSVNECVICMEQFKCYEIVTGLPCLHIFHKFCIYNWLVLENSKHRCPVCRWPARLQKGIVEVIDLTD
ncbi:E3 ubiquitin-protein ligase RNF103 [Hydra vulgaris]|uniref:E3 ubiquitin-protein ligase RNF103 n=1 Tax=Hydra vulgaris TaxID=6087 RepID=UPI0001926497|nr:E3 ubiquitin-protein ligase RNF103 [Hydra vulgaris]